MPDLTDIKVLPRYRCHKIVQAAKIVDIRHDRDKDPVLEFADDHAISVDLAWWEKHAPQPGGYYVRYEDGYASFSPAEAFEAGYRLIAREYFESPEPLLQFFVYAHLKPELAAISAPFCDLAQQMVQDLPRNPERTVMLRELLKAKDAAVRTALYKA